ncbi:MAG: DNA-binding protein [Mycobacteriaceae bacterium]|nr:DNA-binding protein [Mycobacteriaceae bacterium]
MSAFPISADVLSPSVELMPLPDVAELLGVSVTRVHQMLRDNQLLAVRRDGVAAVPDVFFADRAVVKPLPGLITVMRDAKYTDEEILEWMFTEDDTLPGTPVQALHGHLAREVVRRAAANPL